MAIIISNIISILLAIFILGILVFVHELGHFIMAKLNKIGVDAFSVGFGKELFGFTIGETRYRISMIPLGGYCKLRGDENKDSADEKKDPRALYNRPPFARLLAILGGPGFNYLFAVIVMALILMVGIKEYIVTPKVYVHQTFNGAESPAYQAGLRTGDTILSLDNVKINSYYDILSIIPLHKGDKLDITYLRNGQTNSSTIIPSYNQETGMGIIGVEALTYPIIDGIQSNSPAQKYGLKTGDKILSVNGRDIAYFYELTESLSNKGYSNVTLVVARGKDTIKTNITLDRFDGKGFLGVYSRSLDFTENLVKFPKIIPAFHEGFNRVNSMLVLTVKGLYALVQGKINAQKNLSGPVRLIKETSEIIVRSNFDLTRIFEFMVLLSAALGFFNLLPIPGLDGGHVIINSVEMITRRKIPDNVRIYIEYAGFLFIVGLSVLVLFNDIFNVFIGK